MLWCLRRYEFNKCMMIYTEILIEDVRKYKFGKEHAETGALFPGENYKGKYAVIVVLRLLYRVHVVHYVTPMEIDAVVLALS